MALPDALLALLGSEPKYGYQLKVEFEDACGGAWKVNSGQIYTTLQRLERDELIEPVDTDADGRTSFRLTAAGTLEAQSWLATPVDASLPDRDEMTMKLLIAIATKQRPPLDLVDAQRTSTLRRVHELQVERSSVDLDIDPAHRFQLDRQVFLREAELRWLDTVEDHLRERGD